MINKSVADRKYIVDNLYIDELPGEDTGALDVRHDKRLCSLLIAAYLPTCACMHLNLGILYNASGISLYAYDLSIPICVHMPPQGSLPLVGTPLTPFLPALLSTHFRIEETGTGVML